MALDIAAIRNPVLHFRLDLGEPGMLRSARATESTMRVTAQENRNLARLKSEALREGRIILHSGIRYGRSFAGPFLTVTSGRTTVMSREARPSTIEPENIPQGPERPAPPPVDEEPQPIIGAPAGVEEGIGEEPPSIAAAPGEVREAGELAGEEARLRAELGRLEMSGLGPLVEGLGPDAAAGEDAALPPPPLPATGDQPERGVEAGNQEETREVENELRRLVFERLVRQMEQVENPVPEMVLFSALA